MDLFLISSSLTFPVKPGILVERAKSANPEEHKFYSVFLNETKDLVGYFEIKNINKAHGAGTGAHIILSPEYRGRGYGKELINLLSKIAFLELGLYRISLSVHTINKTAIAAYAKAGYSEEGLIRDVLIFDGKRYSLYQMSLLRPEWEGKKREM
jgi:RimJ/RimL family protein N-acetyltransferase